MTQLSYGMSLAI